MKKPKSLLLLMAISLGLTCASAFATNDDWDALPENTPAQTQSGGGIVGGGAPVNAEAPVVTHVVTYGPTTEEYVSAKDGTPVNADGSKIGTTPTKSVVVKKPVVVVKKPVVKKPVVKKPVVKKAAATTKTKTVVVHKSTPTTKTEVVHKSTPTSKVTSVTESTAITKDTPVTESPTDTKSPIVTESPTVTKITPVTEISAVTKDTPETNDVSESKVLTSKVDSNLSEVQSNMIIIALVLFAFCALLFINKLKHKIFTKQ